MRAYLFGFFHSHGGSTVTEYALIATLIAVTIIGAVTILGQDVGNLFNDTADAL
ncbi:MAG: Flp family type IVb pilin [Rhodospirillaceae bacterium]|nr:Flp family type IVb pilin [Rhodospirillaceae bacterium]